MARPAGEADPALAESDAELEALRAEIAAIDRALIEGLQRRLGLSARIGRAKAAHGMPIVVDEVERCVLARAREEGRRRGLPDALLEGVFRAILEGSVACQRAEARVRPVSTGRALVVGGAGGMGRWLRASLAAQGWTVDAADPALAGTRRAGEYTGLDAVPDLDAYDASWVAVPLGASATVLGELIARRPRGTLVEVASIKASLRAALEQAAGAGVEVLSLHPMFGPSKGHGERQTFVLAVTPGRAARDQERRAEELLTQPELRLVSVPFDLHDELMAWLLGLGHLAGLLFASSLARSGLPAELLEACASTTYLRQGSSARSILAEDPELYLDIQHLNPHRERVYDAVREALDELREVSARRDAAAFRELVRRGRVALDGDPTGTGRATR